MPEEDHENGLKHALQINRERRALRHAEAAGAGAAWLVECRDLWDAHDEDAGVYFVACATDDDVTGLVGRLDDDNPNDRILGIYRISEPITPQGPGLTRAQWLSGLR